MATPSPPNDLEKRYHQRRNRRIRTFQETGPYVRDQNGHRLINFSSNDYLGLARHPYVIERAQEASSETGTGATASRLVVGGIPRHDALEEQLAHHKGYETALLFGSGFLTNLGIVQGLTGPGDWIFLDRLSHASLLDAARGSQARWTRFHHNDPHHLERRLSRAPIEANKLIVTESIFSMDGDLAPLKAIADLAQTYNATVLIDEAHASGVFGPHGAGRIQALGLTSRIDLAMGTLSKALGSYGGFVVLNNALREWLVNFGRSLIYSTALPPSVIGAAQGALEILEDDPERGQALLERAAWFRGALQDAGFDTMRSESHIIPIRMGTDADALALAQRLEEQGILCVPIRPPTVPEGHARLRFSLTHAHQERDLEYALEALETVSRANPSSNITARS